MKKFKVSFEFSQIAATITSAWSGTLATLGYSDASKEVLVISISLWAMTLLTNWTLWYQRYVEKKMMIKDDSSSHVVSP